MLALSPLESLHVENDVDVDVIVADDGKLLLDVPTNMSHVICGDFPDPHFDFLDTIDFDDIFNGPDDLLPGLELVVPELSTSPTENNHNHSSCAASNEDSDCIRGDGSAGMTLASRKRSDKRRKSSSKNRSKGGSPQEGKRKVKVDWTPELHKRFVEAVEKLGVDKAVPSRILEVMGARSLTRHNIASHLQKYRSHRKHLLAREAEAASWNQRRRMYAAPHLGSTRDAPALAPWVAAPAMGFPSVVPPQHHYRPLLVWGHPTMNRPIIRPWPSPNQVPNPPPLPMPWAATPLNPPYWKPPQHHQAVIAPHLSVPFSTQPMVKSGTGFVPPPPVPGVLPPKMFETDQRAGIAPPPPEFHPSKETIDAAIGEVLTNRTLPLPLGLKPPSMEGVIGELQRQGLTKIPPPSPSLLDDDHHSSTTSMTTTIT